MDVVLEVRIDAAPETVFALLTDPAHMKTWFAERVEADPHPGGLFRVFDAAGVSIEGTYLEVIANNKVVFTWGGVEGAQALAINGRVPAPVRRRGNAAPATPLRTAGRTARLAGRSLGPRLLHPTEREQGAA